ncbi:MAG: hydroxyisourate hydrolase [Candidatus Sericytochromatia bacterium]|nr:hydroxyisourate hydrolase [Candidatus Sericytochromatia bacterium]
MNSLSTHILNQATGRPAGGVPVTLLRLNAEGRRVLATGMTDGDGRVRDFLPGSGGLAGGTYALHFDTASYFQTQKVKGFYPYVEVVFELDPDGGHTHVPLLLSPYGFSTYRGS